MKTLTLSGAIEAYLAELALIGRSPKTVDFQTQVLRAFVVGRERQTVVKLTRAQVVQYLGGMADKGLSQAYVGVTAKTIKRLLSWLVQSGHLGRNPLDGMAISMGPETFVIPLRDDEIDLLLNACQTGFDRAVVVVLLDCGLRASEFCNLRWTDINLVEATILIRGKGGYSRMLGLNPIPRQALTEYLREAPPVDGWVWPQPFDVRRLERMIDRLAKRAGTRPLHPHLFRHSWASRLYMRTENPLALRELGGWHSWAMVEKYTKQVQRAKAVALHREHPVV